MRGRKPIPTKLHMLRGNPGKRARNPEPSVAAAVPECPGHLSDGAREEWDRVAPMLLGAGLVTKLDRAALAAYCAAYARWVDAEQALKQHGVLIKSPSNYPMLSPYLTIANKALEQMQRFLVEFGMSPSSRARVTPSETPPAGNLAKFLSLPGGRVAR